MEVGCPRGGGVQLQSHHKEEEHPLGDRPATHPWALWHQVPQQHPSCWGQRLSGSKIKSQGEGPKPGPMRVGGKRNSILLEWNAQLSKLQLQHTINKGTCKAHTCTKVPYCWAGTNPAPLSPPTTEKTLEINVAPRKWQDGLDKGSCLLKVMVAGFAFTTNGTSTGHLAYSKNGIK